MLARIAQARGDRVQAFRYDLQAPDIAAVQDYVTTEARTDPRHAFDLERTLRDRLIALKTHPDAVAEADWQLGPLAAAAAYASALPSERRAWNARSLKEYRRAARLAPLDAKYWLSAANQALGANELKIAAEYYDRMLDANPGSANALAGLGIVALRHGDRASALARVAQARERDASAALVAALERALR